MRAWLKQLEFLFVGQAHRLPLSKPAGGAPALQFRRGRDYALESQAHELLRELGAAKLAREIRVEWNPRMRTAAGRADFRKKLISLNPLLRDHAPRHINNQLAAENLECNKHSSLSNDPSIHDQTSEFECN